MGKAKRCPAGVRTNANNRKSKVVDNEDFTAFMRGMGAEPRNRKERREWGRKRRDGGG